MRCKRYNKYYVGTFVNNYRIIFDRAILNIYQEGDEYYEELQFFKGEELVHSEPAHIFFGELKGDSIDFSERKIDR